MPNNADDYLVENQGEYAQLDEPIPRAVFMREKMFGECSEHQQIGDRPPTSHLIRSPVKNQTATLYPANRRDFPPLPAKRFKLYHYPQGHAMAVRVEDEGKSKCPTVMAGIRVAILPGAKVSRLPSGLPSRENLANRLNGISR